MNDKLQDSAKKLGFQLIELDEKGGELAVVKGGDWISVLAEVAKYVIENEIKKAIETQATSNLVKLHEDSLLEIEKIVRRETERSRALEYMADSNYVIRELDTWRLTGRIEHLNLARDRASLLISRVKSLGDEYLGALMVATTNLLATLMATEKETGNAGYRETARAIVREYGFNGILGHGTNRLRIPLEERIRRVTGCRCHYFHGPEYEGWTCKCTDADGNTHSANNDYEERARRDCESQRDEFRRNAQHDLDKACSSTINPLRATMAIWEQI